MTLDALTDREQEVARLIAQGLTNDEIGATLFLSPHTIKDYVGRITSKLGARGRRAEVAAAVVRAEHNGTIERTRREAAERIRTAAVEAFLVWNDRGRTMARGRGGIRVSDHAYICVEDCGCVTGAAVDNPQHAADMSKTISEWVRRGASVERVPVEEARERLTPTCPHREDKGWPQIGQEQERERRSRAAKRGHEQRRRRERIASERQEALSL